MSNRVRLLLKNDRVFGAIFLAISVAMAVIGWRLVAPISYEPIGPRNYPLLLAGLMGAASMWFIVRPGPDTAWPNAALWRKLAAVFALLLTYALLFRPLGFALATTLLTIGLGRLYGGQWRASAVGGVLMGIGLYIFFDKVLDVTVPVGDLWKAFFG